MGDCSEGCTRESCEGCPSKGKADFSVPMNADSKIKHVLGIVSGKGGVGKSSVTAMLAVMLRRKGFKVGILDADITGPSIPHMFGVSDIGGVVGEAMIPAESKSGIKIISINLMLEQTDQPVIWRGPVIAGVVKQFWKDVIWGELDYLLVDMPPGTGDVVLTVFQSLPVDGVLMVASPQNLVEMVVRKAFNMARMMNVPVLGVVENYSYLECPDCGRRIAVFGESSLAEWAKEAGTELVAKLPLDPMLAQLADNGAIENYPTEDLEEVLARLPR